MRDPKKPFKTANNLITVLDAVFGDDRYPVNIKQLAMDYSRERFPEHRIKEIKGDDLPGFEGALYGKYKGEQSRWLIMYNSSILKPERINFTLAHELGHYLMHRDEKITFECSSEDLVKFADDKQRESEANQFASQLLMPPHDFRKQVEGQDISFDLIDHCTDRYHVSLTAALLKWIEFTNRRAVLVVSRDGFVLWSKPSQPALKSGVYYKTVGRPPLPIPEKSLAKQPKDLIDNKVDFQHGVGVWWKTEPVREMTVFSDQFDLVISLLIFPDEAPSRWKNNEEELEPFDSFDNFVNFEKRMNS